MTNNEKNHISRIIQQIADREGIRAEDVRQAMQASIDEAWATADPAAQSRQRQLFPAGKPTVEAFLLRMAGTVPLTPAELPFAPLS